MNNANSILTVTTKSGNVVTLSKTTDRRITDVAGAWKLIYCRNGKAAAELKSELAAWGVASYLEGATLTVS